MGGLGVGIEGGGGGGGYLCEARSARMGMLGLVVLFWWLMRAGGRRRWCWTG